MFTMPWSPTNDYAHPLARLGAGVLYGNKNSYKVVESNYIPPSLYGSRAYSRDLISFLRIIMGGDEE